MKNLLKRLARHILREERAATDAALSDTRAALNWCREQLRFAQAEVARVNAEVAKMEPWMRKHTPENIPLLCWAQHLKHRANMGSWTNTGCTAPFARWDLPTP